ncbi:MAG TPA: hypothetical protein DEF45_18950 [Rhodopirellula sp.]|nr:MAG: hypothetical protein CBD74_09265 [Saprospirales bacterium TMED214]HBV65092.1 hypothetical protein [Rhodopirellula sp.]
MDSQLKSSFFTTVSFTAKRKLPALDHWSQVDSRQNGIRQGFQSITHDCPESPLLATLVKRAD